MNTEEKMVILGVATGIGFVVCAYAFDQIRSNQVLLENKMDGVLGVRDSIASTLDVDIPEAIVKSAVEKAVDKRANDAAAHVIKSIAKSIDMNVTDIVKESYNNIEDDVKKALLDKINLQTLDDIKKLAAKEISKKVPFPSLTLSNSGMDDIVKSCAENGMSAWEIERIIKAAKGESK
jgi:hypothetical protein